MTASPVDGTNGVVGVEVTADGTPLDDSIGIVSVKVQKEIGRIPKAVVVFMDGSVASQEFPLTDAATLVPGAKIEIKAGYGSNTFETIFKGIVTAQRLRIGTAAGSKLEITCRDEVIKANRVRKSVLFKAKKDSEIVSSLLGDAGMTADVETTKGDPVDQIQHDCTDWDFIRALADRNGLLVIPDDGKTTVKAPDLSQTPAVGVTLGEDVIRFDAQTDTLDQLDSASMTAWDAHALEVSVGNGAAAKSVGQGNQPVATFAEAVGNPHDSARVAGPVDSQSLEAQASARLQRAALAQIRGTVRTQGTSLLHPGDMLELTGFGDRFSGAGFVSGVLQSISDGAWTTDAVLGLDPEWRTDSTAFAGPETAGRTAPVHGLQLGKVKAITGDEDNFFRIEVELPLLGDDTTVWCRYAAPYASTGFGLMMIPETGDEVVVGFLGDHPDHGIILGSLHGKNLRPEEVNEANNTKLFKSREGLELIFNEEKKVITVQTPGGNSVVLSDDAKGITLKDQNGNSIELGPSGITIDSAKDITISAAAGVSIEAGADCTMSGLNVSATADASFSASGNASAEVTASGTLKIQGSLVQIN